MKQIDFSLKNKVVLVIGGRGYLASRLVKDLASVGAKVISADLEQTSLAMQALNEQHHQDPEILIDIEQEFVDVNREESIQQLVIKILKKNQRIDILVYAATNKPVDFYKPYTQCSLGGWQQVITTELNGLFLATKYVGQSMEKQCSGNMIFLSSIYGVLGNDQRIYEGANLKDIYSDSEENASDKVEQIYSHGVYNTVKGGVISLARYLAAYWGHLGIRVNTISPGGIQHPAENDLFVKKYSARVPLKRKAQLDEISGALIYLASDASSYVTGQNLIIDGGLSIW